MTKVLILGAAGQLARSLVAIDWPAGFRLTCLGRARLGDPSSAAVAAAIAAERPQLVLNAAAYTAVDRAESEPGLAYALNAALPGMASNACAALGIPLLHVSTDYVFDGEKAGAYDEADVPNPLGVYGASKLAGDRAIEREAEAPVGLARWAILRTSWVFSEIGESFPVKLLRRAQAGETPRVVDDQIGGPTPAMSLAEAMRAMALRLLDGDARAVGLFNFRGTPAMSWHGFAARLLDAARRAGLDAPTLVPISSDDFPTAVRRPRNSVLDCGKIARQCGLAPAELDAEIDRVTRSILAR